MTALKISLRGKDGGGGKEGDMNYRNEVEKILWEHWVVADEISMSKIADKIVALRDDENKQRNTKIIELEEMVVDMHKEIYKLEGAKNE